MASRTGLNPKDVEREKLAALVRAADTPRAQADRCMAAPLDDQGLSYAATGEKIGMREQTGSSGAALCCPTTAQG